MSPKYRNIKTDADRWPLGIFDDALGGKASMTDIDGIVERKGRFLALEFKRPGANLPSGQQIFLARLACLPEFTVFIVWGRRPFAPEDICENVEYYDYPEHDHEKLEWEEWFTVEQKAQDPRKVIGWEQRSLMTKLELRYGLTTVKRHGTVGYLKHRISDWWRWVDGSQSEFVERHWRQLREASQSQ